MDVINIKNVEKSYNKGDQTIWILKNISLDIKEGEFVSLIGSSGSGKSTLLYLLYGIEPVTNGSIYLNGRNLSKMSDGELSQMRAKDIGFIYQFYNLLPTYSVEDNILMPIIISGRNVKGYSQRLNDLLDYVGLYSKKSSKPFELSGGQQQRVAIARALISQPQIILADEPTGNLDTDTGEGIMKLLKNINKEFKTTIVQVTHSEKQTEYGDRIVRIEDGNLQYLQR